LAYAHITGTTASTGFPKTTSGYQQTYGGGNSDAFYSAVYTSGSGSSSLAYSTFFGGTGDENENFDAGIAVDESGYVYLTGSTTSSTGFPIKQAIDSSHGGSSLDDAFVAKIAPGASGASSLIYSTYLGGGSVDIGRGITTFTDNSFITYAYVTGSTNSTDFPTNGTIGPIQYDQTGLDAFIAIIAP
jgi:hypothetical protein